MCRGDRGASPQETDALPKARTPQDLTTGATVTTAYASEVAARSLHTIAAFITPLRLRLLELLDPQPGDSVLDAGCGVGLDTSAISASLGNRGLVIGIDRDSEMVEHAKAHALTMPGRIHPYHSVADATHLPFRSGTFDRVLAQRLLQHVDTPASILAELHRVTTPGGRLVVADCDWASLSIDVPDAQTTLERTLVTALHTIVRSPFAGRQLPGLFTSLRMQDLRVETHSVVWRDFDTFRHTTLSMRHTRSRLVGFGALTAEALASLFNVLAQKDTAGSFFASATVILVSGTAR